MSKCSKLSAIFCSCWTLLACSKPPGKYVAAPSCSNGSDTTHRGGVKPRSSDAVLIWLIHTVVPI